jgi:hypothetical protein
MRPGCWPAVSLVGRRASGRTGSCSTAVTGSQLVFFFFSHSIDSSYLFSDLSSPAVRDRELDILWSVPIVVGSFLRRSRSVSWEFQKRRRVIKLLYINRKFKKNSTPIGPHTSSIGYKNWKCVHERDPPSLVPKTVFWPAYFHRLQILKKSQYVSTLSPSFSKRQLPKRIREI